MCALHAELFCDPFTVGSWRHRTTLKHVDYAFPELEWTLRPIVAQPNTLDGDAATGFADDARDAASTAGLPVADDKLTDGVPDSWAACEALVAARAVDDDAAFELYNRLSARLFAGGESTASPGEIAAVATGIDALDGEEIRDAIGSRRATATLGRELEIGRGLLANRDQYEFRGTPGELSLADRVLGNPVNPLDTPTGTGSKAETTDDDEAENGSRDDEAADPPATVPAPPIVRLRAGTYTVVIEPSGGHQEFADVLQRFDADIGRPAWEEKLYGRHAMRAYGMEKRTAENLSGENYPEKAEKVLKAAGESFVADVAACTQLDPDTCRVALRKLGAQGRAERGPSGGWRPVTNRED